MKTSWTYLLVALVGAGGLGCGGGDEFALTGPEEDGSTDASDGASDGGSDVVATDSTTSSDADSAPDSTTETGDTGSPTDGPAESPDTCTPNECGGCTALTGKVGDPCETCGKLACDGKEAVKCVDGAAKNACGGCGKLTPDKGTVCGTCASGSYVCDGKEATKCTDPVTTPAKDTACGTCLTLKYTCATDGKSTFCPTPDDTNKCGGCGTLTASPGDACGSCGIQTCATDKKSVSCKEGTPSVGTSCGLYCSLSSYVCSSPGVTKCSKDDDRASGTDKHYEGNTTAVVSISPGAVIEFDSLHKESVTSVTFAVAIGDGGSGADGTLDVTLFDGDRFTGGTPLETVKISPSGWVGGGLFTLTATFSGPLPATPKAKGSRFSIALGDSSARYGFDLRGSTGGTVLGNTAAYTAGGVKLSTVPYLLVGWLGCP